MKKVIYKNPVKVFTRKEIKVLAKTMGMKASPNAGKPYIKECSCGNRVEKRYYNECNACHFKDRF